MTDIVFIIFAIIGFWVGIKFIKNFTKAYEQVSNEANCSKGHSWEEVETAPGTDIFYLKCKICKRTLKQVMED